MIATPRHVLTVILFLLTGLWGGCRLVGRDQVLAVDAGAEVIPASRHQQLAFDDSRITTTDPELPIYGSVTYFKRPRQDLLLGAGVFADYTSGERKSALSPTHRATFTTNFLGLGLQGTGLFLFNSFGLGGGLELFTGSSSATLLVSDRSAIGNTKPDELAKMSFRHLAPVIRGLATWDYAFFHAGLLLRIPLGSTQAGRTVSVVEHPYFFTEEDLEGQFNPGFRPLSIGLQIGIDIGLKRHASTGSVGVTADGLRSTTPLIPKAPEPEKPPCKRMVLGTCMEQ